MARSNTATKVKAAAVGSNGGPGILADPQKVIQLARAAAGDWQLYRMALVCHRALLMEAMPTDVIVEVLIRGKRPPKDKDSPLEVIASKGLYLEPETGVVALPGENFFACVRDAGMYTKEGKARLSTREDSQVPAFLEVVDPYLPIFDPVAYKAAIAAGREPEPYKIDRAAFHGKNAEAMQAEMEKAGWTVDVRRGQMKDQKKTTVGIVRPRFDHWLIRPTIAFDRQAIAEQTLIQLLINAGKRCGLGSFRARGGFGKFDLVEWEALGPAPAAAEF